MHSDHGPRSRRRAGLSALALLLFTPVVRAGPPASREYAVRPDASRLMIHVGKTGLLGFLGHKHLVEAPLARGLVRWNSVEPERSEVTLEFDAASLVVLDPDLDQDKRTRIQADMENKVLGVARYPTIRFASTRFRADSFEEDSIRGTVAGTLSLHGFDGTLDVPVEVVVTADELRARGTVRFKASRFGIEQVSAGAGTVKTKDTLELVFDVIARPGDVDPSE